MEMRARMTCAKILRSQLSPRKNTQLRKLISVLLFAFAVAAARAFNNQNILYLNFIVQSQAIYFSL
ncbi:hypothetical protein DQQ10_26340 [Pseudochryseolinea flava]|uniref:Uncharacterized protein n=1 Tax=Pseudochryseolinea flava TaxID=2059302 RepID=A0A364XV95_9BACT|nr:hypothetical protein DQQ10_26340 [Pseudochryseolinea flava]